MKLPVDFIQLLQGREDFDLVAYQNALSTPAPVSLRTNPLKPTHQFENLEKVPWCPQGYYLTERPNFSHDPHWHAGAYYVQEASSMFIDEIIRQIQLPPQKRMLDLCAAPGGKSTLLASHLHADDVLVANEVIPSRANILLENIVKWGSANVLVTQNQAEDFKQSGAEFDFILVDAPCSGEGLFRKTPEAVGEWNIDNVRHCELRQQQILQQISGLVAQDGYIIYSTCTYNHHENIDNLVKFAESNNFESVQLDTSQFPQITVIEKCGFVGYGFYPYKVKGEGFFCGVLKNANPPGNNIAFEQNTKARLPIKTINFDLQDFFEDSAGLHFVEGGHDVFAMTEPVFRFYNLINGKLRIRNAGVRAGTLKGKDFIPAHALALSQLISKNFQGVELDNNEALHYLRKNTIKPQYNVKGYILAQYQGINLGWLKNLGNRFNNLYPIEYRLRK